MMMIKANMDDNINKMDAKGKWEKNTEAMITSYFHGWIKWERSLAIMCKATLLEPCLHNSLGMGQRDPKLCGEIPGFRFYNYTAIH